MTYKIEFHLGPTMKCLRNRRQILVNVTAMMPDGHHCGRSVVRPPKTAQLLDVRVFEAPPDRDLLPQTLHEINSVLLAITLRCACFHGLLVKSARQAKFLERDLRRNHHDASEHVIATLTGDGVPSGESPAAAPSTYRCTRPHMRQSQTVSLRPDGSAG